MHVIITTNIFSNSKTVLHDLKLLLLRVIIIVLPTI